MIRRSTVAGLTLALLLTGCGGHKTAAKPSSSASSARNALVQLAQCARAHGAPNFPDPVQQPDGSWDFPPVAGNGKLPNACSSLKAQLPRDSGGRPSPVSSAAMAKLRQFAACLRRSGIPDWPDPDADGAFLLPSRLRGLGKVALVNQLKPCKSYDPGGVLFKGPAGGGQ
jgi:hypothetical protein